MVSHLTSTSFDNVKIAVAAELECRSDPHNPRTKEKENEFEKQVNMATIMKPSRGRGRFRGFKGATEEAGIETPGLDIIVGSLAISLVYAELSSEMSGPAECSNQIVGDTMARQCFQIPTPVQPSRIS